LRSQRFQKIVGIAVLSRCASGYNALVRYSRCGAIEGEPRHTMNGYAALLRELKQLSQAFMPCSFSYGNLLNLLVPGAQCFKHRYQSIDRIRGVSRGLIVT
jgi:hypothetical protein